MRLRTVAIQNFRLIADAHITIPSGLTLVNGENGLGKSSIFQAILWCLYGPDALGDNQTSLVRQGHRDMSVEVVMKVDPGPTSFTVTRKFSLNPNGKSGRTELHVELGSGKYVGDLSGGTVAEAQDAIIKNLGPLKIFMATAYVDQHDGPGAFLQSKAAEQQKQLRDLLPRNTANWDGWHKLAQARHKTVSEKIIGDLGKVEAAQEFIDQNADAAMMKEFHSGEVAGFGSKIRELNLNLEDLQDEQDEVDKVIAENGRRSAVLKLNESQLAAATWEQGIANTKHGDLTNLVANMPALDEERRVWVTASEAWDERNAEYVGASRAHIDNADRWEKHSRILHDMVLYFEGVIGSRLYLQDQIAEINSELADSPPETHCPTCAQKLESDESFTRANASRQKLADRHAELVASLQAAPDPNDDEEVAYAEIDEHQKTRPTPPVSPGTRPVFESEAEYNSAKSAETDIAAVDAEIKTRAEQVWTLEEARKELPTPDEYDITAYAARSQIIVKINTEITQAEADKLDRERKLAAAENTLELIESRKTQVVTLEKQIEDDQKLQKDLDIVVTGVGPNGARQLMIDQLLGDFQGEVNRRLNTLLPGFTIWMDTQAESGRETFTTAFTTPTGVVGFDGLSGAQRIAVGLSTRLALAKMYASRTGHTFSTWILDEVDAGLRGIRREAFVDILYKLEQEGIDILVVSHAGPVMERMDQRIEVTDGGGYTVVT